MRGGQNQDRGSEVKRARPRGGIRGRAHDQGEVRLAVAGGDDNGKDAGAERPPAGPGMPWAKVARLAEWGPLANRADRARAGAAAA